MSCIAYIRRRIDSTRMGIIHQANAIVQEYAAKGFDLTLRQLYYVFVARDLFPDTWIDAAYNLRKGLDPNTKNTIKNYKRLGGIIDDGRMLGIIDWECIVDRTRSVKSRSSWEDPAGIIETVFHSYHLDRWVNQDYRPEVWVEKEALAGVFDQICRQYDLPLFACRGYTSQSSHWRAAQRLKHHINNGQTPVILHFGDHDPSGIDMTRDILARLETFRAQVEVRRLALNMDQVQAYRPPPNPAKTTDARFASYQAQFGEDSWELDALTPEVLAELVINEVNSLRDMDRWRETVEQEQDERARFKVLTDRWSEVSAHLDAKHGSDLRSNLKELQKQAAYLIELEEDDET